MADCLSQGSDLEDENDVPPLEDMTHLIQQINNLRGEISNKNNLDLSSVPVTNGRSTTKSYSSSVCEVVKEQISGSESYKGQDSFGGFKKGFLNNPKPKKERGFPSNNPLKSSNQDAEIPLIKPKTPGSNAKAMEIPEVQAAMQSGIPNLQRDDWITDELLREIERNPSLAKMIMDPKFTAALSQLQRDPTKALVMLESNPEMQKALKEFSGILGEHFTMLGVKNQRLQPVKPQENNIGLEERSSTQQQSMSQSTTPPSPEDEAKIKDILSDPDVMKVLQDPQVQQLIVKMRNDPEAAQLEVRQATPEMRFKIQKLVDVGILGFAS